MQELKTERLLLRPFTREDLPYMIELDQDPDVVQFLGHGKVREIEETKRNLTKIFDDYQKFGCGLFAAFELSTGEFVGRSGLIPWILDDELVWEIGYTFKKSAWGKGYASETASGLRDWAKLNLCVSHVISIIQFNNYGSVKVAEKIGMTYWKDLVLQKANHKIYKLNFI